MGYTKYARVDNIELAEGVTADSTTVLLTMDNQVLFTSVLQIPAGHTGTIFTLDEHECPTRAVYLPVWCNGSLETLNIGTSGNVFVAGNLTGELHLNGLSYNIASKFYNDELGTGTYEATSD